MKINIRNNKGDDFSEEVLLMGTVLFAQIESCARICNTLDRVLHMEGWEIALFHNEKRAFNMANNTARQLRYQLNNVFDGAFDRIIKSDGDRQEAMDSLAMDLTQINMIYLDKVNNDLKNRARIKKKMKAYKGMDIDLEAILNLFTIKR